MVVEFDPATPEFFRRGHPYAAGDVRWADVDGEHLPYLFPLSPSQAAPDPIASTFFWLAGWQEATARVRDVHGRFPFEASLQARLGTFLLPVVDHYRVRLGARLEGAGVTLHPQTWNGKAWAVVPTHDVDFTHKSRLGTLARSMRRPDRRGAAIRQALAGRDPRRAAVERFTAIERSMGAGATYFFKAAARGPWDAPYRIASRHGRQLVAQVRSAGFEVGLHPSYHAHDHAGYLAEERDRLAAVLGRTPVSVRQHFLRFEPRVTPRQQAATGFLAESSLGFSHREGFRRATCHPFRLYDLATEGALDLWEVPLSVMDTTLFRHRRLDAESAYEAAWSACEAARRAGGCAVLLWHNTAFDEVDFPGEGTVFERLLRQAREEGAALLGVASARDAATRRQDQAESS